MENALALRIKGRKGIQGAQMFPLTPATASMYKDPGPAPTWILLARLQLPTASPCREALTQTFLTPLAAVISRTNPILQTPCPHSVAAPGSTGLCTGHQEGFTETGRVQLHAQLHTTETNSAKLSSLWKRRLSIREGVKKLPLSSGTIEFNYVTRRRKKISQWSAPKYSFPRVPKRQERKILIRTGCRFSGRTVFWQKMPTWSYQNILLEWVKLLKIAFRKTATICLLIELNMFVLIFETIFTFIKIFTKNKF